MNYRLLEKIDENSRIIAKLHDSYLVTNSQTATLNDISDYAFAVLSNGQYLTRNTKIGVYLKHGNWIPFEGRAIDYIKQNEDTVTKDALLGFAVGDALGVPVEFLDRKEIRKMNITEMLGNGSHKVPRGAWSDDTSMLIAGMDSISRNDGEINDADIMNSYVDWLSNGKYSSVDYTFGIGGIIFTSLQRYMNGYPISKCGGTDFYDNGNGSLMRILPFSLYCIYKDLNNDEMVSVINKASSFTHAHEISKMGCLIYTLLLKNIMLTKNFLLSFGITRAFPFSKYYSEKTLEVYDKLFNPNFILYKDSDIQESGYIVDTLEAVAFSLAHTENYEDAIKTAVNLGYDTDTVAGITGSLAGVLYGVDNIPERWLDAILKQDYLLEIASNYDESMGNKKKVTHKM